MEIELPGFRFHPTEEELIEFYLKNYHYDVIGVLNIYHFDPWHLPGLAKMGEREWYFFVPRDTENGGGGRPNRTTELGFWKATGSDRKIVTLSEPKRVIGLRKTLFFYKGRAPRGTKTDWVMNEYRLPASCSSHKEIVLCKIYRKATSLKENCLTIGEISSARDAIAEIEKILFEDFGDAMNTKSQPFRTKKSLAQVQGTCSEQEIVVLDPPNQQPRLQDSTQNRVIIEGAEKDGTSIHFINTTCIEGMPKGKKMSEKDISFESLSEHFGSQLNDAAKSFGVSRSTFKRICRGYGIKRWQSGKRRLAGDISSVVRKINDKETSRRNLSSLGVLHEQETPIVVHTQQDMNKMTVKATYEGVTIRFDLLDSSGMTDLEDNVIKRLPLERKKFTIKYQDDDGDWILIACDKDVRNCMEITRSLKMTTIKLLIDRPLHHCAP